MPSESFHLDTGLIELNSNKKNFTSWTIRNAVEGVQIFGGIGSGKTTGSGRMIALKYLSAGFGGLVLTVKPEERELWEDYCHLTNRSNDLIIVAPGSENHFNFLEYESASSEQHKSTAVNIVQVLKTVIRAREEKTAGKSDDQFWETALDMLMSNLIELCLVAYGKVSVELLYDIAQSLPQHSGGQDNQQGSGAYNRAFKFAQNNVRKQEQAFHSQLTDEEKEMMKDKEIYEIEMCNAIPDARTLKFVDQFFSETYLKLADKTRSIIDFSFSGFLYNLLKEPVYSMFCRHASTFTPDDCLDGKIILIDLPVKLYHKAGGDSQILFKYIWQRAMEKRDVKKNGRPVFLWADEAQHFLHEYDAEYQATARSCRIATVYISQNLPNYLANMGGAKSDYKVKSFLGTLATKIFHSNADIETNRYASDLIGDILKEEVHETVAAAGQFSASRTKMPKFDKAVRPEYFTLLKTGGEKNKKRVEGYVHVQGSQLSENGSYIKTEFDQNYKP